MNKPDPVYHEDSPGFERQIDPETEADLATEMGVILTLDHWCMIAGFLDSSAEELDEGPEADKRLADHCRRVADEVVRQVTASGVGRSIEAMEQARKGIFE